MDRRDHHRVQLRLPARLRWTTPFGQKTEVCASVDVSRGGMLVPCREPHAEGATLWVTFPFDASLTVGQPEVLARVVRAVAAVRASAKSVAGKKKNGNGNGHGNGYGDGHRANGNGSNGHGGNGNGNGHKNGNGNGHHGDGAAVFRSPSATEAAALESGREVSDGHADVVAETASAAEGGVEVARAEEFLTLLALRFEIDAARQRALSHAIVPLRDVERRAALRRSFVVPVRVRTEQMPWFEETMTIDCSSDGLKFRSNREYARGEFLFVSFEGAATSPWLGVTESLLRVVRVESEPDVAELRVAVCRTQQFAFRF
jgi:PilZ domain